MTHQISQARTKYKKVFWMDNMDRPQVQLAGTGQYFHMYAEGSSISIELMQPSLDFMCDAVVKTWVICNPSELLAEV